MADISHVMWKLPMQVGNCFWVKSDQNQRLKVILSESSLKTTVGYGDSEQRENKKTFTNPKNAFVVQDYSLQQIHCNQIPKDQFLNAIT